MSGSPFDPLPHSTMRETEAYWKGVTDALWELRCLWEHVPPKRRLDSFISHHTPDECEHGNSPGWCREEDWIQHGGSI